jgi:hypothetical protein
MSTIPEEKKVVVEEEIEDPDYDSREEAEDEEDEVSDDSFEEAPLTPKKFIGDFMSAVKKATVLTPVEPLYEKFAQTVVEVMTAQQAVWRKYADVTEAAVAVNTPLANMDNQVTNYLALIDDMGTELMESLLKTTQNVAAGKRMCSGRKRLRSRY